MGLIGERDRVYNGCDMIKESGFVDGIVYRDCGT